jgi:hypothetical protein
MSSLLEPVPRRFGFLGAAGSIDAESVSPSIAVVALARGHPGRPEMNPPAAARVDGPPFLPIAPPFGFLLRMLPRNPPASSGVRPLS